jgi:hypothetical protein
MTYVWASKVFASVLEHLKHNVKVLTGRGAIIGSENILGLVSSPAIRCRIGEREKLQTNKYTGGRVRTRRLVFPLL